MGQGADPRYLWPREQVFQPPFVPCCVGRFVVRFVLAGIVGSSIRMLWATVRRFFRSKNGARESIGAEWLDRDSPKTDGISSSSARNRRSIDEAEP